MFMNGILKNMTKPIISKLEYDIIDHCNLGCNFCIHNSQFKPKSELDVNIIEDELTCLFNKFDVEKLCLKGGEPLIHQNIMTVLSTIKKYINKDTKLSIATNGIKLSTLSPSFFILINHLNIHLCISEYEIDTDYEKIYSNLKEKEIKFTLEKKPVFWDFLDNEGNQNPVASFTDCQSRGFYPLYRDKRFYLCCFVYDVPFVNNRFKYKIESDSVSINDDVKIIMDYISHPCSTCRFCSSCIKNPKPWSKYKK